MQTHKHTPGDGALRWWVGLGLGLTSPPKLGLFENLKKGIFPDTSHCSQCPCPFLKTFFWVCPLQYVEDVADSDQTLQTGLAHDASTSPVLH